MLSALAREHEFTVFSVDFDNPCPERIRWVRVPAIRRPLALLFVSYHLMAPLSYWFDRIRTGQKFDFIQKVESKLLFGRVAYTHFCHTSYLKHNWSETQASGLRGMLRWLDHRLHALFEKLVYSSVQQVLVPSNGLAAELKASFPEVAGKTAVLPNAVDVARLQQPVSFDRTGFRTQIGFDSSDVVLVFCALGHFERKGLPVLIESLQNLDGRLKLLVVGGQHDLVSRYQNRAESLGLSKRVVFVGAQSDVRPYLWAADAFVLASAYETFSLVAYEAAAASLPLITTRLHGVEEIAIEGETGFVVRRAAADFATAFERLLRLTAAERAQMGRNARDRAIGYTEERFLANWRDFYAHRERSASLAGPLTRMPVWKCSHDGRGGSKGPSEIATEVGCREANRR